VGVFNRNMDILYLQVGMHCYFVAQSFRGFPREDLALPGVKPHASPVEVFGQLKNGALGPPFDQLRQFVEVVVMEQAGESDERCLCELLAQVAQESAEQGGDLVGYFLCVGEKSSAILVDTDIKEAMQIDTHARVVRGRGGARVYGPSQCNAVRCKLGELKSAFGVSMLELSTRGESAYKEDDKGGLWRFRRKGNVSSARVPASETNAVAPSASVAGAPEAPSVAPAPVAAEARDECNNEVKVRVLWRDGRGATGGTVLSAPLDGQLGLVMDAFCDEMDLERGVVRFVWGVRELKWADTPSSLDWQDDVTVSAEPATAAAAAKLPTPVVERSVAEQSAGARPLSKTGSDNY
jgi:hypothetical protein